GGHGLVMPQELNSPVRLRRPVCKPDAAVNPGPGAGGVASSVEVMTVGGGPVSTLKERTRGLPPPAKVIVNAKSTRSGQAAFGERAKVKGIALPAIPAGGGRAPQAGQPRGTGTPGGLVVE